MLATASRTHYLSSMYYEDYITITPSEAFSKVASGEWNEKMFIKWHESWIREKQKDALRLNEVTQY